MAEKIEITLDRPVTVQGRTLERVALRRPTAGDLRRMDEQRDGDLGKMLWLIGRLGELSPEEVDALDGGDLEKISGGIEGFLRR